MKPASFFRYIRLNVCLNHTERQTMFAGILASCRENVRHKEPEQTFTSGLETYEQALLFAGLRAYTKSTAVTEPTHPVALHMWHGTLFSHLQPFRLPGRN